MDQAYVKVDWKLAEVTIPSYSLVVLRLVLKRLWLYADNWDAIQRGLVELVYLSKLNAGSTRTHAILAQGSRDSISYLNP